MEKAAYNFIKKSEENHWWFVGRRLIIDKILQTLTKIPFKDALDIGSGFGAMIPILLKYSRRVDCIEPLPEARAFLEESGASYVYDIVNFPEHIPNKKYNLVSFFDVLEHIRDQEKALLSVKNQILRPNGKIIITVPAYQWMWSNHDDIHHHFRRYTKKGLTRLLSSLGFQNIKTSYFMTFLFPCSMIQRLQMKGNHQSKEFQPIHPILNFVFKLLFSSESLWIRYFPYPFGLSVIAVAEI